MKISNLKLLTFFFVSAIVFVSCNNDTVDVSEPISADEAIALAEVDDVSDEINNIIDDFFVENEDGVKVQILKVKQKTYYHVLLKLLN